MMFVRRTAIDPDLPRIPAHQSPQHGDASTESMDYLASYFRGPLTWATLKSFPTNVQQANDGNDHDVLAKVRAYRRTPINQLKQ